jgi:STE24 endopeptidase
MRNGARAVASFFTRFGSRSPQSSVALRIVAVKNLIGIGLAMIGGVVLASTIALAQQPPEGGGGPEVRNEEAEVSVTVTPEMERHSRIRNILYFAGFLYGLAVLLLILATRLSRRMADVARRMGKKYFLAAMIYFVFFTLISTLLSFPLDYYSGFVLPHQFDLSNQNFSEWLVEGLKQLGIGLLLGAPVAALALLGIRKLPNRWWLALWIGAVPLIIFLIVIQPILIDPIFNKFEPLQDEILRDRLLETASIAGIEGGRVYQVNKSKQTKTMNAYVNGIGPSKRIVMWDTLLEKMNRDETVFVMAHEMGHYVLHHLWKGLAFTVFVLFFVMWTAKKMVDAGVRRFGPKWGFDSPADPAALPLLLLVLSVITFVLSPVFSGYSRYTEHQADIFALEVTRDNVGGARAFKKLAEDSKVDPRPHPFIEFWRYSHPSLARRIDFALTYKPWEEGNPNRVWRGSSQL